MIVFNTSELTAMTNQLVKTLAQLAQKVPPLIINLEGARATCELIKAQIQADVKQIPAGDLYPNITINIIDNPAITKVTPVITAGPTVLYKDSTRGKLVARLRSELDLHSDKGGGSEIAVHLGPDEIKEMPLDWLAQCLKSWVAGTLSPEQNLTFLTRGYNIDITPDPDGGIFWRVFIGRYGQEGPEFKGRYQYGTEAHLFKEVAERLRGFATK